MGAPDYTFDRDRLQALAQFDILDTPPERGFDDIVDLTAQLCNVPVALVSLVADNRQWFKARVGIGDCETDLNSSVCAHALIEPDLLVIPDLTLDVRTRDNPLVQGAPFIRFYAGAPLRTAQSHVLGSLCAIDTEPRPGGLTEAQAGALRNLARQVMSQLELRRALAERDTLLAAEKDAETRRNGLLNIGDRLRNALTIGDVTRSATAIIGESLKVDRAAFGHFDSSGEFVDVEPDWTGSGIASAAGRHRLADYGHDLQRGLLEGDALIVPDVLNDPITADHAERLLSLDIRSVVNVPVIDRGRTTGILIVHAKQPRTWPPETLVYLRNIADRVEAEIARIRAETQQRFLNHELSHRMKNTMALVQAIASQTLRTIPEQEPVKAFSDRLMALSLAHDVLLRQNWGSASVGTIVESTVCAFADIARFDISGQTVALGSRATQSLSLVLHELTTNALKYGALSNDAGRVALSWKVEDEEAGPTFHLDWREVGGPAVTAPTLRGFGTRLLKMGLGGTGGAQLAYHASGFEATFATLLADLEG
ncbi:GAF domain-containing protein [Bradyrhizobium manausense]|uniref:GAF domain-containing protein n=1 Tax=Bradyrhizobium manausense TaxID=989370 RepID=UPI00289CBEF6|nr:GAF domain-containing protein [Bradyrhizobium manausense]